MNFIKIVTAYLGSPRQELSNGGPKIVATLSVFRKLKFSCVYIGGPIQLYYMFAFFGPGLLM